MLWSNNLALLNLQECIKCHKFCFVYLCGVAMGLKVCKKGGPRIGHWPTVGQPIIQLLWERIMRFWVYSFWNYWMDISIYQTNFVSSLTIEKLKRSCPVAWVHPHECCFSRENDATSSLLPIHRFKEGPSTRFNLGLLEDQGRFEKIRKLILFCLIKLT